LKAVDLDVWMREAADVLHKLLCKPHSPPAFVALLAVAFLGCVTVIAIVGKRRAYPW